MHINFKNTTIILIILIIVLISVVTVLAASGTTDSITAPGGTSSYSLEDIFDRLSTGATGSGSVFSEPSVAPGVGTMHSLDQIMNIAPARDGNSAAPEDVFAGKTYWGLSSSSVEWGKLTGQRFSGCLCSGTLYDDRFCDNGNGTVTDLDTCMVWLQDASCMGSTNWDNAIRNPIVNLRNGDCSGNLTDGSVWGDWRLPSEAELKSFLSGSPSLACDPGPCSFYGFENIQSTRYWTSTKLANGGDYAWWVHTEYLGSGQADMSTYRSSWPVRSGN